MRRSAILAAAVVAAGGAWYVSQPAETPGLTPFAAVAQDAPAQGDETAAEDIQIQDMTLGEADAPLQVIEYASFTCPHCATFHETVFEDLKTNYIDSGQIQFVHREVYFDRYGLWAGMVARCGGEDSYFGIADLIYERQRDWAQGSPAEIADNLRRIGRTAGLSDEQLDACMSDGATAEAMVANFERNAEEDEITATPSFVIDGETYSNMSYGDFSALIDEKLSAEDGDG